MPGKVSIFGCGVQKGGTTSLYAHLCEHPELSAPVQKELHFFDDESRDWAAPDYAALEALFPASDGARLRFDITPIYGFWPPAIARIHAYNPQARLIYLFRDPFERAWSQWCMEYARGFETLPFSEAIRAGRARLAELPPLAREQRIYTYIERGCYAGQVRRALRHFPREQVLFLRSRDLLLDHVGTLRKIAGFLGIGPFVDTGPKREQPLAFTPPPFKPDAADLDYIAGLLGDDVRAFAQLSGLDVTGWPVIQRRFASGAAAGV
ncbi:deacetylase sulfotransferase [Acidocella aquatica]|uniref:Deacetylase sulfotransferase n=1 Tax=Acidocella aquatica TaxID=1922313 RepID=A0ABQ6A2D0_9PROT|nr:sulfotransferase [Acidocella aquatica]GLR65792.1 deacetylase sulfotransferase [Acidocella aquatica]